jgi:hypothetical protein
MILLFPALLALVVETSDFDWLAWSYQSMVILAGCSGTLSAT